MDLFCIYYDPISHITKNLEGLKVGENRYFGGKRGGSTVLAIENSGSVSKGDFCTMNEIKILKIRN